MFSAPQLAKCGITGPFVWLRTSAKSAGSGHGHHHHHHDHGDRRIVETVLFRLAIASYIWLGGGCLVALLG